MEQFLHSVSISSSVNSERGLLFRDGAKMTWDTTCEGHSNPRVPTQSQVLCVTFQTWLQATVRLCGESRSPYTSLVSQCIAVFWRQLESRTDSTDWRPAMQMFICFLGVSNCKSLHSFLVLSTKTFLPEGLTKATFLSSEPAFAAPSPFPSPFCSF